MASLGTGDSSPGVDETAAGDPLGAPGRPPDRDGGGD
jgi:hypothetical protein